MKAETVEVELKSIKAQAQATTEEANTLRARADEAVAALEAKKS